MGRKKTKLSKLKTILDFKMPELLKRQSLRQNHFSKANLVIFVLVFGAIGGYILLGSKALGPTGTANLWMAPQGTADAGQGACIWNATPVAAPADLTQACKDFQAANMAAPATGGTVDMVGGNYLPTGYLDGGGANYTAGSYTGTCTHVNGNSGCLVENACRPITGNNHTPHLVFQPAPGENPHVVCQQAISTTGLTFRDGDRSPLSSAAGNLWLGGIFPGDDELLDGVDIHCLDQAPYPLTSGYQAPDSPDPGTGAGTYGQFCSAMIKGSPQNFTMLGGSVGPTYLDSCATDGINASWDNSLGYSFATHQAHDVTFDGTSIHHARYGGADAYCRNNWETYFNTTASVSAGASVIPTTTTGSIPSSGSARVWLTPPSGGGSGTYMDISYTTVTANSLQGVSGITQTIPSGARITATSGGVSHTENFYLTDVLRITMKNMIFNTCGSSTGVFVTRQSGSAGSVQSSYVSFINDIFNGARCGIDVGYANHVLVQNSDFPGGGFNFAGSDPTNSVSLINSIFYENVCPQNGKTNWTFTFSHNIWEFNTATGGSTSNCGGAVNGDVAYNVAHDPNADLFVDWKNNDFHLKAPPNIALDAGDVNNYLSASPDYYGQTRYFGAAPDIGAAEFNPVAAGVANLWVDTDGGSCTRSATYVAYNTATACASMQAAMTAAQAGDIVIIKNGTYPGQTITSGTKASVVSFYAETSSQVLLTGALNLDGVDKIHIYGVISAGSGETRNGLDICDTNCAGFTTQDILIDGFHGKSAFIRGTNVVIDHSEFGNFSACLAGNSEDGFRFWDGTGGSVTPTNDILRNSVIHDIDDGVGDTCQGTVNAGRHVDCMQNNGGINLTFEKNIFYNCPTSNIQDSNFGGATISNILVQNNYFGPAHCCNSIVLGPSGGTGVDCSSLVVRYNTFDGGSVNPGPCGNGALGLQVYGNIFATNIFACLSGMTYSYNIFHPTDGPTCGTNYKRCSPTFVNILPAWGGAQPDPHLAANDTCAIDAGDPANYPPSDFDGDIRPQGAAPDAGADEYVLGTTTAPSKPGDLNNDGKVNLQDLSILLTHYGQSATPSQGDINGDGRVTLVDLSILLSNYGS